MQEKLNLLDRLLQNRVLRHAIFWLAVLLIAPLTHDGPVEEMKAAFIIRLVAMPTKMLSVYFLIYYLIPKFYQRRRYTLFIVLFLAGSILLTILYRINNVYIAEAILGVQEKESIFNIITSARWTYLGYFNRVYGFTWIFLILKTIKDQAVKQRAIERLEKEKTTAELNFLKAQIH
ncbi:MAG: hypothetical protein AAF599_06070, partial [Bacteroidota bacterium]